MYEGFGYIQCVGYYAYPFMITPITRYALEHGIQWSLWQIVLIWMIYVPALVLARLANWQKHTFRTNPYSPAIARKYIFV